MTRVRRAWSWLLFAGYPWPPAHAQTLQFFPEVDAYLKLNSAVRINFQAKGDREGGDPLQTQIGPSIELYVKPLVKLKHVTVFDLNDAKARMLVLETGYRYLTAPDAPVDNRMLASVTFHVPLVADILFYNRSRADLDWKQGLFKWRYRNKMTIERTFSIRSRHLIPYLAIEPYYTSQYAKWSTTEVYAGCLFPIGKHVQFDSYYEHENNTGKKPNEQSNDIGLALHLYFNSQQK
jgi:hypothetical protein